MSINAVNNHQILFVNDTIRISIQFYVQSPNKDEK